MAMSRAIAATIDPCGHADRRRTPLTTDCTRSRHGVGCLVACSEAVDRYRSEAAMGQLLERRCNGARPPYSMLTRNLRPLILPARNCANACFACARAMAT